MNELIYLVCQTRCNSITLFKVTPTETIKTTAEYFTQQGNTKQDLKAQTRIRLKYYQMEAVLS